MTVCQLIEKLHGIAAIWDGDAEIRLNCEGLQISTGIPVDRSFQIQGVTGYTPPRVPGADGREKPAIVDMSIRLWGKPE